MRNPIQIRFLAAWIILCVFALTGEPSAGQWTPVDKAAVLEKASEVTRDKYPDADVAMVDQHMWVKYNPDGTYEEWFEQYIKVLTEKGKRRYRTLTSSFTVPYNTTKFKLVEVISPDGTSHAVDVEKNSSVMVDPTQMASNIYDPNDKVLQVSISELEIGDIVHVITYDDFFKTRMAHQWSDFIPLEGTDPIVGFRVTVMAPKTKPLRSIALKDEIPGTVSYLKTVEDSHIVYQWVARDVPMAFAEPEMPPLYTQAQRLLVSTISDWKTISRWYWNLSRPHLDKTTPEMLKTVRKLTGGKKGQQERIESIFFWVSQKVRYLGITAETEAPGYEPHPVSMTFERRAGVCRDKAALLVAMLRLAGFDAYPVLIMNGPKKDPEVPQPFFNHAIACVKMRDGSYLLMDPTNENTKELFPAYLNNQSYVVATPKGETLLTSPITPAEKNLLRAVTSGKLDGTGMLRGTTTIAFNGINDNAYRGYFSRISEAERKLFFERILMKALPGATLGEFALKPVNMMDTSEALQATFTFSARDYPVQGDGVVMLPMLRFTDSIGMVNFLIKRMGLKERRYTYVTETACGIEEVVDMELDPSLGRPVSPTMLDQASDDGSSWNRSLLISDGVMKFRSLFKMKLTEYSPGEYKHLQDTLKKIETANRHIPLFTKGQPMVPAVGRSWYDAYEPDAVILDEDISYDVTDESTFTRTVRKRIKVFTYAGKKKHSELHFSFNPVWEDIRIKKATVTSPNGLAQEINPNEVNIMDQDWVGKAPRYPAGKVMVVSLPGLQEGSTIEYEYVHTKKDAWPVFISSVFQDEDPVEKKHLSIRLRAGMNLNISKADNGYYADASWRPFPKGFITENIRKEGDDTVWEYGAYHVPPMKQEDSLPPGYVFMPTVMASATRMKEYATRVRDILEGASDKQNETEAKAFAVTRDCSTEEQKIRAVRDFVEKNIKPVGMTIGQLPLKRISPADETLAAGYGNSADRAVLLSAMLKPLGYKTQFLMTSTASPLQSLQKPLSEYPASDWFASVLVKVVASQGKTVILGDTDQYAELGTVSSSGTAALNLSSGLLEPIEPSEPSLKDRGETRYLVDLSPNGDALITIKRSYYGAAHAAFCKDYLEMSPEERRRRFQEITSSVSRSAVAASPYKVDCQAYPATEDFIVSVPGYAVRQGDILSLELPGISRGIAGVVSEERSNPLYRDTYSMHDSVIEIWLPEGAETLELRPPEMKRFALPGSSELAISTKTVASIHDSNPKGRMGVIVRQHSVTNPWLVMPREYPDLLDLHQAIANPGMRTIVARMKKQ